tara:strand:+ start:199 stop:771 length:573 start_codon:yes stop_codon:yes gene_type:complete
MHNNLIKVFYFINEFIESDINKLNKNISIIYRNYNKNFNKDIIRKIRDYCKTNKIKFYISYHYRLAIKFKLDGIYIPAFDKRRISNKFSSIKNFEILGSAHNLKELKIKEKQGCTTIFISPIFKVKKSNHYLNTTKFNILANNTRKNIVALGGINNKNLKKLNLTKSIGFASISLIKKNGLNKFRPFFKF